MRGRRQVTVPAGEKTASAERKDSKTTPVITNLCQQGLSMDKNQVTGDEGEPTKDCQRGAFKGTVRSEADSEKGASNVLSGKCLSDCSGRLLISACDFKPVVEYTQTAGSLLLASKVLKLREPKSKKPNVDNRTTIINSESFFSSNSANKLVLNPATALESLITKPPDNGDNVTMPSSVEGFAADNRSTVSGRVVSAEPLLASVTSPVVRKESSCHEIDPSAPPEERNVRLPLAAEFPSSVMTNLMRGGSGLLLPGSPATGSVVDSVPGIETDQRSESSPPTMVGLSHLPPPPRHVEVETGAPVEQWSAEYVCRWLAGLGWREDVRRRFESQQVTGEVLLSLTERDFKEELDLRLFGERRSLALAIARLKRPSTSSLATPSATPPSSGSPQHSPATHHHYYHHAPSQPTSGHHQHCYCYNNVDSNTVGIDNGQHHHPFSAVLANDNGTNSGGDNTTNGGDSGVGAGEWEAPPVRATCGCPACHQHLPTSPNAVAHKLLKQRRNRHRCKSRRHYYSSDSDDEAEEEDKEDDDKDEVPDGASRSPPSGVLGSAPGASLGGSRKLTAGGGGGYRTASRLRSEYFKTAISCFYMFLVTWITAIVMVFVHDRVPDRARHPPLPDIFLDNVPHIPWAFQLCEVTIIILTGTLVAILCFHKHRCIIMRRFAALSGTVFLLRCATMFITSLSVPGSHLQCSPRERRSVWRQVEQAWVIWQGGGLSIKGVRTCGDYMFSGHTTALTMLNFFITEYTPRRMYYVHISSWVLNMFGVFFVLAAHEHYSIDVFIAFYITSRMFLYYHSLANNRALHQRDSFRTKIWFPMFSFFESNINGIVPNEYNNPFAISNLLWAVQVCVMPVIWGLDKGKVTLIALSGIAGWRDITAGMRLGGRSEGGSCGGSDRSVKVDCVGDNAEGASQASKASSDNNGAADSNVRTAGGLQSEGGSTQKPLIDVKSSRCQNTDHKNAGPSAVLDERIFSVDNSKCSGGEDYSTTSIATRCRGPTLLSTTQSDPSSSGIVPSFSSNLKATSFNLKRASSKLAGNGAAAKPEKSVRGNTNKKKLR